MDGVAHGSCWICTWLGMEGLGDTNWELERDSWCHAASWRSGRLGRQPEGERMEESIQLTFLLPRTAATEGEVVPSPQV